MGSRTLAVAVLETTSVMVAAMMLTIRLITQTGSPLKVMRYWTSHVEKPEIHYLPFITGQEDLKAGHRMIKFCS